MSFWKIHKGMNCDPSYLSVYHLNIKHQIKYTPKKSFDIFKFQSLRANFHENRSIKIKLKLNLKVISIDMHKQSANYLQTQEKVRKR